MPLRQYRRSELFFTVNVADRREAFLTEHIGLLRTAFQYVQERYPCTTEAIVILPDHLHVIWTLPAGDANFPTRWRLLKTEFSRKLAGAEERSASRLSKGERGIWQRRYWEHLIREEEDLARHVDYIHINRVKHGYVKRVADWPHSSFHRFVAAGILPPDWAGSVDVGLRCGEPES